MCVTLCTFFIARITTINVDTQSGEGNIFGVSDGAQAFFNTGLLGAIITTIVGSLAWRIIAASFPLPFLGNPVIYIILRLCLLIEASGICSAAWLLALINRQIFGYQDDQVYIGRLKDRIDSSTKREPSFAEGMEQTDRLEVDAGSSDD